MKIYLSEYSLKPAFMSRSRREKILALLFLVAMVAIWFSSISARVESFDTERKILMANKKQQNVWLENRQTIDVNYQSSLTRLTEADLPNRNDLAAWAPPFFSGLRSIPTPFTFTPDRPSLGVWERQPYATPGSRIMCMSYEGAAGGKRNIFLIIIRK